MYAYDVNNFGCLRKSFPDEKPPDGHFFLHRVAGFNGRRPVIKPTNTGTFLFLTHKSLLLIFSSLEISNQMMMVNDREDAVPTVA